MGVYINKLPDGTYLAPFGKADAFAKLKGSKEVNLAPPHFETIPKDKIMVCVLELPQWEAAFICDTEFDFKRAINENNPLPRRWFLMERELVKQIADSKLYSEYNE